MKIIENAKTMELLPTDVVCSVEHLKEKIKSIYPKRDKCLCRISKVSSSVTLSVTVLIGEVPSENTFVCFKDGRVP